MGPDATVADNCAVPRMHQRENEGAGERGLGDTRSRTSTPAAPAKNGRSGGGKLKGCKRQSSRLRDRKRLALPLSI